MSDILHDDDPAMKRFIRLHHALGDEPLSGYESACLARLAAWSSEDDIRTLTRLIHHRCRVCFDTGRANARRELEGGGEQ